MSNESLKHIFDASTCLTKRQMKDYVTGIMTNEEAHAVEVHLSSCPMCNDAVEGMFAVEEGNAVTVMNELNADFLKDHFGLSNPQIHLNSLSPATDAAHHQHQYPSKKKKIVPLWRNISIAAAILLCVGIAWYLKYDATPINTGADVVPVIAKNENPLIQQPATETKTEQLMQQEALVGGASMQQVDNTATKKETQTAGEAEMSSLYAAKAKQLVAVEDVKAVKHVELNAPLLDKFSPGTTQTIKADEIEKMPSRDVETIAASAPKAGYTTPDVRDYNKNRSLAKSGPQVSNNYSNNKQEEAVKLQGARTDGTLYIVDGVQVRDSKASSKGQADKLEQAKAYYTLNKFKDALSIYEAEMKVGGRVYRHDAAIGAARCYVKLGNKSKAREILQSIIDEGGSQKREAKRMMKGLE